MELIANWLWQGSIVVLATAVMLRAFDRLTAQARYRVCAAALLAVLSLPLPSLVPAAVPAVPEFDGALPPAGVLVALPNAWWTSNAIVLLALALWSATQGVRVTLAAIALRRTRKRCRPFPSELESRLSHWTRVRDGRRRARLVMSPDVGVAAVLAGSPPLIAVARPLLDQLTDDELDRVVIHEWAHVQRRDDFANAVQLAARALAGWHPAVWWIDRRLRAEREAACDEMAVAVTGSTKAYAACLVKLAGLPRVAAGPLPALGMSSRPLTARIERVLSRKPRGLWRWSTSVAMAGIVVVAAVSFAAGSLDLVDSATILYPRDARPSSATPVAATDNDAPQPVVHVPAARRAALRRLLPPRDDAGTRAGAADVPSSPSASSSIASESFRPPPPLVTIGRSERAAGSHEAPIDQFATLVVAPPPVRPDAAPPAKAPSSPWAAAADAGTAIGRSSKKAGVATAGLFTRMGKAISASFSSGSDARSSR